MPRPAAFATLATVATLTAALAVAPWGAGAEAQISFDPQVTYSAAAQPDGVAFGDFGGDGRPELAATMGGPDRIEIRTNGGTGSFGAPVSVLMGGGSGPHSLAAVNIDNDADLDLVVTLKNTNQVRLLINTAGVFAAGATTGVGGTEPRFLAVADLDGNGFADVVTANRDSGDIAVLLNSGGVLGAPALYAVGGDTRGVAIGDVDGDLLPDIVAASGDARALAVFLNLPSSPGIFATGPSLSVGAELRPDGVDIQDLDGDGDRDVVTATSGNGLNFATVFSNLGGATFGPATGFAAGGLNPGTVVAADLDRDGGRDLVLANQDSATLTVLRNLGGGSFATAMPLAAGANPQALAVADLDRDGGLDLGCANQSADTVSVYRNTAILFANGFEAGIDSGWTIVVP
ncbi:MAG: repeat-containing protein [Acidobacteriota bacterium]|nr:repeat-containing protein [Acidobacteriota bacterium]